MKLISLVENAPGYAFFLLLGEVWVHAYGQPKRITKNDFYLGIGMFWFLGFAVILVVLIAFGPMLGCDLGLKACP